MPQLTPEQLAEAVRLQARCWTQSRIADALGVHQSTVSRALARHNDRILARLTRRSAATRGRQLEQLEWIVDQAVGAWELQTEEINPALLREARAAMKDIRDLLGLGQVEPEKADDDFEVDLAPPDPEDPPLEANGPAA